MTKHLSDGPFAGDRKKLFVRLLACGVVVLAVAPVLAGCSGTPTSETPTVEATGTVKGHGVQVTVRITPEMLANKPQLPDLATPEDAVRSYLDWISYAYRIGDSDVAKPAMSALEEVRVNSYVQYNLQEHSRVIDQELGSITFGTPVSKDASTTILTAKEKWSYKWVSVAQAGKVVGGPFSATYDTTYTVIKNANGTWVVDSVEAKKVGKD
jgi:hypothetical protein